jgi:hypothetical protein
MTRRSYTIGVRCIAITALLAVGACESPSRTASLDDDDDAAELHQSLDEYAASIQSLLQETQEGQNISSFSLGMLSYDILTTVSSADKTLYDYFTAGGQDVQGYLKKRFQTQPELELAALDEMNPEGSSPLRSSARYTLEALTHIPNSVDPPAVQQRSREELANALKRTEVSLSLAAEKIPSR